MFLNIYLNIYYLRCREVCFTQNYHTRQVTNNVFRLSRSITEFDKINFNIGIGMCNRFGINISNFNNFN